MMEVSLRQWAQVGNSIFYINTKMTLVLQKRDVTMDNKFKIVKPLVFKNLPEAKQDCYNSDKTSG